MAKSKKSIDDLDAELAALEAELAALEGKPKVAPAAPKRGLPFGKRKETPPSPAAPPEGDLSLWRHDGEAWVRTVPGRGPAVRRVLDEHGDVIREEPLAPGELEEVDEVKAERGVGKLFGRLRK